MTLALIAAILFGIAWSNHNSNIRADAKKERARTITNISLQDELFCKNLAKVFNDLLKMDEVTPLVGDTLFEAIDYLYKLYDIPDDRTFTEKLKDKKTHLETIKNMRWSDSIGIHFNQILGEELEYDYPEDETKISLFKRIWLICDFNKEIMSDAEKMFGAKNSVKIVDGTEYKYNDCGFLTDFFNYSSPLTIYIKEIVGLLTRRDLYYMGYNYSPRREHSLWQQSNIICNQWNEKIKKYPWLYR